MRISSLLIALSLSALPASANLLGDIKADEDKRSVAKAAKDCAELRPGDKKGDYLLAEDLAGQEWALSFNYGKKRRLESLLFEGSQSFPQEGYDDLVKAFYLFCEEAISKHFGVAGATPLNTPAWELGRDVKAGEFAPMHAYAVRNEVMLTIGVVRRKDHSYAVAFRLSPYAQTAMGSTGADNNHGSAEEWQRIPLLDSYPAGKQFLADRGLLPEPPASDDTGTSLEGGEIDETTPDTSLADNGGSEPQPDADGAGDREPGPDGGGAVAQSGTDADGNVGAGGQGASPAAVAQGGAGSAGSGGVDAAGAAVPAIPEDADLSPEEHRLLSSLNYLKAGSRLEFAAAQLRSLSDAGDLRASYALALCYEQGKGVPKDGAEAVKLLYRAAAGGYALAMVRYGEEYGKACEALRLDEAQARALADKAAADADEIATVSLRYNYAVMLRYGYGTRKDVALARDLLRELADLGDSEAAELLKDCVP